MKEVQTHFLHVTSDRNQIYAERREELGKEITQWRKSQGHTVATASAAPAMFATFQEQLDAANERIEELEGVNDLLEGELESSSLGR